MNTTNPVAWQGRILEVALTVSHTKKKTIEKTEFTKGQQELMTTFINKCDKKKYFLICVFKVGSC